MNRRLKEIATVQMGYPFRSRLLLQPQGKLSVIQMKDLVKENRIDYSRLTRIDAPPPKQNHLVKPGDLIFRSRGLKNTATLLVEDPGPAVVAAPLLWIRVPDKHVMPEYLHWYISQPRTQVFFSKNAKGTLQPMISKEVLETLEVPVPDLERQRSIVELAKLEKEEQHLMRKLTDKRRKWISIQLNQLVEGA